MKDRGCESVSSASVHVYTTHTATHLTRMMNTRRTTAVREIAKIRKMVASTVPRMVAVLMPDRDSFG